MRRDFFARVVFARVVILAVGLGLSVAALAGQRSFVASFGSDTYPCNLAQPCRSFNTAIAATTPGGEVVILDTAGYGPMTIDRSIKVIGPTGVYGGISVLGGPSNPTTGITINAPGGTVILRGLDISGVSGPAPLPNIGIDIQNARYVHIEKSSISNFTQDTSACIRAVTPGTFFTIYLVDSFLRECRTGLAADGTLRRINLQIDNTRFESGLNTVVPGNTAAIVAVGGGQSVVRNSVAREFANGIIATNSSGFGAGILVTGSLIEDVATPIAIDASANSPSQITLERSEIVLAAAGPALTVNATTGGTARLTILDSLVHRGGDPVIKTTGGGGSTLVVDVVRSTMQFIGRVLDHGYGAVSLNDNHIDVCSESLVNSGSGNVVSRGNSFISCDDLPGPIYITPTLAPGK